MILFLVIYTAIFTPYVAAFLLNEPGYGTHPTGHDDPIVVIDLIGMPWKYGYCTLQPPCFLATNMLFP